ncbi:uncharacterized protein LOC113506579 [Trichoplusia ni]|uniref:Uncharacterized protein LOC113503876 n=1 Tax=Trichoplusia ni TaxID=7111 RepID=A0A7E5WYF1_TRINI|nr:uncharacterized protein LOC113503876 [Trichoplusia ni]XP_026745216.1 uncharacterized protein LOC113506579 [Trichoplusia ni]
MCWAEKCCYFIPANIGCVVLGVCSFFLSSLLLATSITVYVVEIGKEHAGLVKKPLISEILVIDLNVSSVRIILWTLIIIAVMWMVFSGLLVVGIVKNIASFVLCYFAFSIFMIILCQLCGLLVLLANNWKLSIILFAASAIYIHFIVVVHTVYDLMVSFHCRDQDEELLADCFDEDNISRTLP